MGGKDHGEADSCRGRAPWRRRIRRPHWAPLPFTVTPTHPVHLATSLTNPLFIHQRKRDSSSGSRYQPLSAVFGWGDSHGSDSPGIPASSGPRIGLRTEGAPVVAARPRALELKKRRSSAKVQSVHVPATGPPENAVPTSGGVIRHRNRVRTVLCHRQQWDHDPSTVLNRPDDSLLRVTGCTASHRDCEPPHTGTVRVVGR